MSDLDPEDAKIVTLARATRARADSRQGAAVRDLDGRTYAGADVDLPSLRLSALQVAVAMAASSGAAGLEAVALVGAGDPSDDDLAAVRDLGGGGTRVLLAGRDGSLRGTTRV